MNEGEKSFSLDHLDSVEFEEFCYDLLDELGFVNINWRKGTGLNASPSDQGRDIECQLLRTDIDEQSYFEKWFVECKHYQRGVPSNAVQSILSAAEAEVPEVALIIVSNFLSNPTKNQLDSYKRNRSPRFRIKIWEKPDLKKLTIGKFQLLRKYKIVSQIPLLSILHPAHVMYMKGARVNTLDYLFGILDKLTPKKRDRVFSWIYEAIIKPKATYHTSVIAGMEVTTRDKLLEEVSYKEFKRKCYQIANIGVIDEPLLVFLIVNWVVNCHLGISDTTSVDEFIHRMESLSDLGHRMLANRPEDQELRDFLQQNGVDISDRKHFEYMVSLSQERIKNIHEDTERNYELYKYFCQNVLEPLLYQELIFD